MFNGKVNLSAFDFEETGTTTHFNGTATIGNLVWDTDTATPGGTGKLSVRNFNLTGGKSVTIDGLSIAETSAQNRSWNSDSVTSVNLKNGAVLDTRHANYSVQRP